MKYKLIGKFSLFRAKVYYQFSMFFPLLLFVWKMLTPAETPSSVLPFKTELQHCFCLVFGGQKGLLLFTGMAKEDWFFVKMWLMSSNWMPIVTPWCGWSKVLTKLTCKEWKTCHCIQSDGKHTVELYRLPSHKRLDPLLLCIVTYIAQYQCQRPHSHKPSPII